VAIDGGDFHAAYLSLQMEKNSILTTGPVMRKLTVMKSPFPGMDPYMESRWGDVHHSLIQYTRDALQANLPGDLRARVEERVFVESEHDVRRGIIPDVYIVERRGASFNFGYHQEQGGIAVAEPLVFEVHDLEITEGYIEIRERGGGKVITVIEFLSPANKSRGAGQEKYVEKQVEVLQSHASLVEIDLVRAGKRILALPERDIPEANRTDYLACISLGWMHRKRELYPMSLRKRLPVLPIPLRKEEPRIDLDLQALINQTYVSGRYDDLDYGAELDTPLEPEDAQWLSEILKAAKR
jgi:hypothetical protein